MTAHDPHGDPPRLFAADVNLGFPLDDAAWREFFAGHGVQIASYDDTKKLTEDLGERDCDVLSARGQFISEFFAELVQVAPYQGQIDAVVADRVDATMVQEDVWRKRPANGQDTRVIAKMETCRHR